MGNILLLSQIEISQALLPSLIQLISQLLLLIKWHPPVSYSGEHPTTLLNRNEIFQALLSSLQQLMT